MPGLLIEVKPTSKSLPSTGTCILEISIKEGFGAGEALRNTQYSGFIGDPMICSAAVATTLRQGDDHLEGALGRPG